MKKYLLLLVGALCFCLNIVAQTYPKKANVIRLLTYNSHYCKGGTDPGNINSYNTQRFALVIKTLDADIVSLQELDSAANSRGKRYLLNEIAQATGLNYTPVYGKAASYDGGSIGCGTLVKKDLTITKVKKIPLPGDEPRVVVRTDFEDFVFMSTHFDLNDNKRIQGAGIISTELDYIRKPVFLAGDLNDSHCWGNGGIAFPTLMNCFEIASDTEGNSIPGRTDNSALIDYVLFRDYNNSGIKVVDTHIVRSLTINGSNVDLKDVSDHYPVFVDVELPGATGITDQVKKNVQLYYDSEHESITILSSEDIDNVEIYQITGQKIKEVYGENTDRVSLSGLNKGIYLVKIIIGNKYIVEKIMKN